jgi:hypothetical protein
MQIGSAAAQCMPDGHRMPVAPHCDTSFEAHAVSAAASAPRHRSPNCRVIELMVEVS